MKKIIFITFAALLFQILSFAAPVKISFLNNSNVLNQTAQFLIAKGCDRESVKLFQTAVRWNNEASLGFDLKKFPKNENGFYSFQSISNLVNAFSEPLIYANHPSQLNCFDNVILIAGNLIQTTLKPDSFSGPFLVPTLLTNFMTTMAVEETPQDAFNFAYSQWYIEASKSIFRDSMQEKRICLTVAFASYCIMPHSATNDASGNLLLKVLQETWKHEGIIFPTNMEVVICYNAVLKKSNFPFLAPFANSSHAGLLFQNHGQYIYIEKSGVTGPYVRLDFSDRKDLIPWLRSIIEPASENNNFLFATFNDQKVESLK